MITTRKNVGFLILLFEENQIRNIYFFSYYLNFKTSLARTKQQWFKYKKWEISVTKEEKHFQKDDIFVTVWTFLTTSALATATTSPSKPTTTATLRSYLFQKKHQNRGDLSWPFRNDPEAASQPAQHFRGRPRCRSRRNLWKRGKVWQPPCTLN